MSKKIFDYIGWLVLWVAVFAVCCAVLLMFSWVPVLWTEPAAAWAQAIGSIAAIFAAIWVSYDQQKKQRVRDDERDDAEVRNMLRSIRDEMSITYNASRERNGKRLTESKEGTPFLFRIPFAERPFPIYEACCEKLGKIPDDELRALIIMGHGHSRGLVLSIRYNNGLVEKFEYADHMVRVMNDDAHHVQKQLIEQQLCAYGDSLRTLYKETTQHVEEMIGALDKYLSKP